VDGGGQLLIITPGSSPSRIWSLFILLTACRRGNLGDLNYWSAAVFRSLLHVENGLSGGPGTPSEATGPRVALFSRVRLHQSLALVVCRGGGAGRVSWPLAHPGGVTR
jgi:hypothetical protein